MDLWFIQGNENVFVSDNFLRDRRPFLFVIPTRISCHVALDAVACAPLSEGKAHEIRQRHQVPQEIRGSVAEGSAVSLQAYSQPLLRARRAASMRLAAPSLLIASDK